MKESTASLGGLESPTYQLTADCANLLCYRDYKVDGSALKRSKKKK